MICGIRVSLSFALAGVASAALLAANPSHQETQDGSPPTFRLAADAVQVSVIVTDVSGRPVAGLTQDDFEIFENNHAVPVTTFIAVDIPLESAKPLAERDVLSNDGPPGRLYVIALDRMDPEDALRTRRILRHFIEHYFTPNDTAAVVHTTGAFRDSGQEFTSNPRLLLNAIDKYNGGIDTCASTDCDWHREKNFMGDFKALMIFMATLRGARKAVIFAGGPIPGNASDLVDYRPGPLGGLFSNINPDFLDALSLATRNNIAIYAVGPASGGLSEITGGFSIRGRGSADPKAYDAGFERLVRENSTYYVLGFNSVDERSGTYSRIDVRVKRPGLTVRALDGYITPRRLDKPLRRAPGVLAAAWDAVASGITTSGLPMRAYAAAFKGRGGDATVAISLEIAANRLQLVNDNGIHRGEMDIVFAITGKNGLRPPIIRHRAQLELSEATYERIGYGALRVMSQLRLPKGKYQIRASAGGAAVAGSVVYDIEVPDFEDDLTISGLALTSSATRETLTVSPHPRIDVDFPGPPTTVREFARDDRLTLYAEVYENRRKPHKVTFTVELRDQAGRALGQHSAERETGTKPKKTSSYAFSPTLSLEDVPAGDYVLRVDARSSLDENKPQAREIPIRVR